MQTKLFIVFILFLMFANLVNAQVTKNLDNGYTKTQLKNLINSSFDGDLSISKWNETQFDLLLNLTSIPLLGRQIIQQNDKITLTTPYFNMTFYNLSDGYEFEIALFNKITSKNSITFPINVQNMTFYYQTGLNETPLQPGVKSCNATTCLDSNGSIVYFRPENVVGSYAVYGNKQNNKYETGKIFHLYRPLLTDADGKTSWGNISINIQKGLMTLSIDPTFFANARFPLTIDPTFGYTTKGASGSYNSDLPWINVKSSTLYTASTGDTVTQLSACIYRTGVGAQRGLNFYSMSGSTPNARMMTTVNKDCIAYTGDPSQCTWENATGLSVSLTNGVSYAVGSNGVNGGFIAFDTGTSGDSVYYTGSYSFPDPWTTSGTSDNILSQYATYTAGGSPTTAINLTIQSPTNTTYTNSSSTYNLTFNYTPSNNSLSIDRCWFRLNATANVSLSPTSGTCINGTVMIDKGWNNLTMGINSTTGIYNQTTVFFTYNLATGCQTFTCGAKCLYVPSGCWNYTTSGEYF